MEYTIAKPLLDEHEIEQVTRVIKSGMIASGPETLEFEREFSEFAGTGYSCAVTNGTVALSVALSACGIRPGDEVITSPFTFVATANAILSCGAIPVFADIDEESMNIPMQLEILFRSDEGNNSRASLWLSSRHDSIEIIIRKVWNPCNWGCRTSPWGKDRGEASRLVW